MSSSQELYNRLIKTVQPLVTVSHIKQMVNWMWITVGILQANSVALSKIATHIPSEAKAASRVTMIRRWLMNFKVDMWQFYRPILEHVLSGWHAVNAVVVLDGVMVFGDRLQIFRLSLAHGCRAVPLGWVVIGGTGVTQVERLEVMLTRVAQFLAPRVAQVTFLADRGFRDCDWAQLCLKLQWHYVIRVARNTHVTLPDGRCCRIDQLGVTRARRRYFQDVWLTQEAKLCAHLSVTWTEGDDRHVPELLALISDQRACRKRLREYAQRMCIEQSFRDDKSGGFDLAHTRLQDPQRLERLLLALAIATLWCHELGEHILSDEPTLRRQVDPGDQRELSLFQLGLRWLKRCVSTAIERLPAFAARLSPLKLSPVVKSALP